MIVAGSVYVETCVTPRVRALMGSGGRAAMAVANLDTKVELHTFHPPICYGDLIANFEPFGISVLAHPSPSRIEFLYQYPLAQPRISPIPLPEAGTARVSGEAVLRFGCLEGDFIIDGGRVVYDPQSGTASPFASNGSRAQQLAIVLNAQEALEITECPNIDEAAAALRHVEGAAVVVIKDGIAGAHVFLDDGSSRPVPPYDSATIYKIGSGDVFTALFAHHWVSGDDPVKAADAASRYTAHYVETQQLPCPQSVPERRSRRPLSSVHVYLVGDSSTTAGIWLIDEARRALISLGAQVFSPYHDLLPGLDVTETLSVELMGSQVVVALSPGVGSAPFSLLRDALKSKKRVIAFAEDDPTAARLRDLGCVVSGDLTKILYDTFWEN